MDTLKEQMIKDLQLKGITPRTQKKYLREVSIMASYFDKPIEELEEKEIKDYLVHMLETRKLSRGTYRGYVAGIKFLYKTTLNRQEVKPLSNLHKRAQQPRSSHVFQQLRSRMTLIRNLH